VVAWSLDLPAGLQYPLSPALVVIVRT
jgi:hypothetical protein